MVCNNSIYHDRNCPDYKNNKLKGAAEAVNQQQPKYLIFNHSEVQILAKILEICRLYIRILHYFNNHINQYYKFKTKY